MVGVGAVVGGPGESSRLVTVTGTVPPLPVLVISEIKQNTDNCQADSWWPLGVMGQLDESLTSRLMVSGNIRCIKELEGREEDVYVHDSPISRDITGRSIVHHLLASHPVIVTGPVRLGERVGPEQ